MTRMYVPAKNFLGEIDLVLSAAPRRDVAEFLDAASRQPRYLIGRNKESLALAATLPVSGIIDDWFPGHVWEGLPIVRMDEVDRDSLVLNCSTSISPIGAELALAKKGFNRVASLGDILCQPAAPQGISPWFVQDQRRDFDEHRDDWRDLYEALADDVSRQTLADVVRFRLTADLQFMRNYTVRMEAQYFEEFLSLECATFVDAGGFDGDTTQIFCDRYPNYKRVYLLEPSPSNMAKARQRLAPYRDIHFMEMGLSDRRGSLSFDPDAGSASSACTGGHHDISVAPLDQAVLTPVSFIKMDLEGWEMPALRGSAGHIIEDQPELAIAVYHQASDFRDVFKFARRLLPRHRIHLRHYTQGWSETVMYFSRPGD